MSKNHAIKNVSSTTTVNLNLFLSDGLSGKSHGSLQPSYTCRVCGKVFNRAGLNLFLSFFNVNQSATGLQSFKNTYGVLKTSMDNTLYIVCLLKVIMGNITDPQQLCGLLYDHKIV